MAAKSLYLDMVLEADIAIWRRYITPENCIDDIVYIRVCLFLVCLVPIA